MALTPLIMMASEGILANDAFAIVPLKTGEYLSQVIVADYLQTASDIQGAVGVNPGDVLQATADDFVTRLDDTAPYISNRVTTSAGTAPVNYTLILDQHIENLFPAASPTNNQEFVQYALISMGVKDTANKYVNSAVNGLSLNEQTFTTQDALMTGNISAVNLNVQGWGQELINSGTLFDFSKLDNLGTPQGIIEALMRINMLPSIATELDAYGLDAFDLQKVIADDPTKVLKPLTQKRCYDAFTAVTGDKLTEILDVMVFTVAGITTLADLLDLTKVFPSTYTTLTAPFSGTLQNIYTGTSISAYTDTLDTNATASMPEDQAKANYAFAISLEQIKGIIDSAPAKIGEQAANIETNDGLANTGSLTEALPASTAAGIIVGMGGGTGPNGTFYLTDFVGAPAGKPQNDNFDIVNGHLTTIQSQGGFDGVALVLLTMREVISGVYTDLDYPFASGESAVVIPNIFYTTPTNATGLIVGYDYEIIAAETTDFTTVGAPNNLPGTVFTATGSTTGTGTVYESLTATGAYKTGTDANYNGAINALMLDLDIAVARYMGKYPTQHTEMFAAQNDSTSNVVGAIKQLWDSNVRFELTYVTGYETGDPAQNGLPPNKSTTLAFAENLHQYGKKTDKGNIAEILEAMATNTQGGNAVVAAMREGRNLDRLSDAGVQGDNVISDQPTTVEPGDIS